jgi:hypothetical protein
MILFSNWYFPWPVKFIAGILAFMGWINLIPSIVVTVGVTVAFLLALTMHQGFIIDRTRKKYKEYTWFLGWKSGEEISYLEVEYIFIKPSKVSRTYHTRVHETTISNIEYDGFLRFSETSKIHLFSSPSRKGVIKKLMPLKGYLNTRIIDYTNGVAEEI